MVAISHAHRLIIIKTIKTGGTSVEMFFEPLCTPPEHIVVHFTPSIESEFGIIGRRREYPPSLGRFSKYIEKWYNHMPAKKYADRRANKYLTLISKSPV